MKFEELREINKRKIEQLKIAVEDNPQNTKLQARYLINTKIEELLEKDEALFFNIAIEEAYKILEQILDDNYSIKDVYVDLTAPEEYKKLRDKF